MASTKDEKEGSRSLQIMENWTKYTPTEWIPPADVILKEPD